MKKIITICLCVLICLCFAACGEQEYKVPMGFQLASDPDVPDYRILVPSDWVVEDHTGTTTAYFKDNLSGKVLATFSASFMAPESLDITLDNYFDSYKQEFEDTFGEAANLEVSDIMLSGEKAKQHVYTATFGDTEYKFWQVVAFHENRIYTLTYSATSQLYENYAEDMSAILEYFEFIK